MSLSSSQCTSFLIYLFIIYLSYFTVLSSSSSSISSSDHIDKPSQAGEESLPEVHCSRERSRAAWDIIEEYLMPFLEKEGYKISRKCRIHPDNDIYRDQEEHKIHKDVNEWECGYCQKSFYTEKFLDQHFHNRHYDLLNVSHGKCLADLCGPLHCDLIIHPRLRKTKCNPAAVARNRRFCESIADSCFPASHGQAASITHEFFLHQFCTSHTCDGVQKPFSRGQRKRRSIFYLSVSILIMMFLPLFYLFIYLYQRGLKSTTQDMKRIPKMRRKNKAS